MQKESAGDNEALKQQIADLQEQNRQKDTEHQNELKTLKLTNAIKMAISSTAQDSDLVAGLVDRNKLILGEDGKVAGLEEQVKALKESKTSVYKGYKQDKIEMRGDRAEMSDFPLYLNTVAGGLDCRDQTIGGFSFVVKIYAVPVIEIIG